MKPQKNPDVKQLVVFGRDTQGDGVSHTMHFDTSQKSQAELYDFIQDQVYSGEVSQNVVKTFEQVLVTEIEYRTLDLSRDLQRQEDKNERLHHDQQFTKICKENAVGEKVEVNAHNFHNAYQHVTDLSYGEEEVSKQVIVEAYEAAVRVYEFEQSREQESQQEFALER